MVGAFEYPVSGSPRLMLQVLQEALVKTIGVEMSGLVEPAAIARNMIGRIEAQAREHMSRDLGAFLRRRGIDRVHALEFRREHAEHAQLPGDSPWPQVGSSTRFVGRIGMDQLPDTRDEVRAIQRQKTVQEGGARARQPGDEDRPLDPLFEYFGRAPFFLAQTQQVGQKSHRIPARREAPEEAQVRLLAAGTQQILQRLLKRRGAEIDQPRPAPGARDQFVGAEGIAHSCERSDNRIGGLRDGSLKHRHLFQPTACTACPVFISGARSEPRWYVGRIKRQPPYGSTIYMWRVRLGSPLGRDQTVCKIFSQVISGDKIARQSALRGSTSRAARKL